MSRKELLSRITYFDILVSLAALAVASVSLTIVSHPGWTWNDRDSFGLGLFLCTTLAFILLRQRVSAQRRFWLHVGIAALTLATAVVLFRRWSILWVAIGALPLVFVLSLRSKAISEGLGREDIYRALLIVGGMLFAMILAEGILRLFPDLLSESVQARVHWRREAVRPWHVSHPYFGHLHNIKYLRMINAIGDAKAAGPWAPAKFDAWGFRNTEPWPERVDIITVGDSVTYSLTVNDEQAWPVILERALAPRRILNLGLIGGAPQQFFRLYEAFGPKLSPKVVLVGLFLRTDLGDTENFDSWSRAESHKGFMEHMLKPDRPEVKGWLRKSSLYIRQSYLYMFLQDVRTFYRFGLFRPGMTVQLSDGGRTWLVPERLKEEARFSSPGHPAFAMLLKTLEDIQALAAQTQTHYLVLFFPSKEEVYLPIFGEAAADLAAPLFPELDKRGIAYLDLGPHFRQRAAAGETLFWKVDVHPNARGYALIAQVVLAHLQEHAARFGLD